MHWILDQIYSGHKATVYATTYMEKTVLQHETVSVKTVSSNWSHHQPTSKFCWELRSNCQISKFKSTRFLFLSIISFNSGSTAVSSLDCLLADMESFKSNKEANSRGRKVEIQVWGTILGGETLFHFLLSSRLRTRRRRRSWRRSWTTWRTSCLELFRLGPKPQRRDKRKAT